MKKVLLLSMPFGSLDRPSLGISLLKARLAECGIDCDIRYLTYALAEFINSDEYRWISSEVPYTAFAGDWTFVEALYGHHPGAEQAYIDEILVERWQVDPQSIDRIRQIRAMVPYFLDHCLQTIDWEKYAVAGFTSTFEQNIASLALAQRIKEAHPSIAIVFGGANWEAPMGLELHRQFSFVDYACSGEAERSFPALIQRILNGEAIEQTLGGIIYRAAGESIYTGPPEPILEMDSLPIPDFADYFRDITESTVAASVVPSLLFETSRGCWWGAKSHCTFCGLNGGNMAYRSKSAARALDELTHLVERWQIEYVEVVDNILDMKYFREFLPALARTFDTLSLFYEVKANLTRDQLKVLHEAGVVRIQPGIESMNDHVLKLMRKGTSALRNIQLLKWCKEYGITVDWNLLHGFPGETQEDYDEILAILPAIRFLGPPHACSPIRLDRFSPHFDLADEYGLTNLRPIAPYPFLYPLDDDTVAKIAYYFDFDYQDDIDPSGYASDVFQYVEFWRRNPEMGTLTSVVRPDDTLVLVDSRSDATQAEFKLSVLQSAVYQYCDALHSGTAIVRYLRNAFPDETLSDERIHDFLHWLVDHRLMVTDGVHFLSLAIPAKPLEPVTDHAASSALAGRQERRVSVNDHNTIDLIPIASVPEAVLP